MADLLPGVAAFMRPLGVTLCLTEEISDGNCLLRSSERITLWVRVKGKLTEGSLSHHSANCAPCRSNLWRTAMVNLA